VLSAGIEPGWDLTDLIALGWDGQTDLMPAHDEPLKG
jgi:hypothetical protein